MKEHFYAYINDHLPASQRIHRPLLSRIGSPVTGLTLIIEIGYAAGNIRDMKPMAPTVLSVFTVPEKNVKEMLLFR